MLSVIEEMYEQSSNVLRPIQWIIKRRDDRPRNTKSSAVTLVTTGHTRAERGKGKNLTTWWQFGDLQTLL